MPYVPGFENDIFISYAHADDVAWIEEFRNRLEAELKDLLGARSIRIWRDRDKLRNGQLYQPEIARSVSESAILIAVASPNFSASEYCRKEEIDRFLATGNTRRARFQKAALRNQTFTLVLSILPPPGGGEHKVVVGKTPVVFHHQGMLTRPGTAEYERAFQSVLIELKSTLFEMWKSCPPVFVSPYQPRDEVKELSERLRAELHKRFYRILPADLSVLLAELDAAEFSSHILSATWDADLEDLIEHARTGARPWVTCTTPVLRSRADIFQQELLKKLEADGRLLVLTEATLWSEIRDALLIGRDQRDRKRVGLIVDEAADGIYANAIRSRYADGVDFWTPDPTQRFLQVDGVLAIAGNTSRTEDLAKRLIRIKDAGRKGFAAVGPEDQKAEITNALRQFGGIQVIEQYGGFDPAALDQFFSPLTHHEE